MKIKKMSRGAGSRHAGKKRTYRRKNKNKPVAKIVTKGFWTKKRTAALIVAIFVGLGIVAGITGYYLSREEKVEAEKGAVYPQGSAWAQKTGDLVGLKVIGGKTNKTSAGDYKMRFVLENRLGVAKKGETLPEWRGDIIKTIVGNGGGWVSLPLQVWGTEQKQWFDVFATYFGSVYQAVPSNLWPWYKTKAVLRYKDGTKKIFPTDKAGGLPVYAERPGYYYYKTIGTGPQPLKTKIGPKSGYYRWCLRFPIDKSNWNKIEKQRKTVTLNPDLIKRMKELGNKMREYRTYYYDNARKAEIEKAEVAGRAGLKAPDKLNATVSGTKVTLTWDQKNGLNAKGFTVRKRVKGTSGWTSESTILNYPANKYEDTGVTEGKTYDYQLRVVSYFDGIKADGPTKSVKVGDGGGITEPFERYPAPRNLKATVGDKMVSLRWDAPDPQSANLTGYKIVSSTTTEDPNAMSTIAKVPAAQRSYLNTGLTNGQTYHYAVFAAYKDGKKSSPAGPVSATPKGADVPEDVNQDGLVNWLDVGRVLAYNGFPGVKVGESFGGTNVVKAIVREDVNRDDVVDWLDIGRILAYKGFPQTSSGGKTHEAVPAGGSTTPATEAVPAQ